MEEITKQVLSRIKGSDLKLIEEIPLKKSLQYRIYQSIGSHVLYRWPKIEYTNKRPYAVYLNKKDFNLFSFTSFKVDPGTTIECVITWDTLCVYTLIGDE